MSFKGEKLGHDQWRATIIGSIITAFATIFAAIIGVVALQANKSENQALATGTALSQTITKDASDQHILEETVQAFNFTPTSTDISTEAQPTASPTNIPPSITPTPKGPEFSDDFEMQIKPEWKILYGNLGMANGNFTVLDPFNKSSSPYAAIVEGQTWSNTRIRVTLDSLWFGFNCNLLCEGNAAAGVIIRHQDGSPSIGLLLYHMGDRSAVALGTLDKNLQWSIITSTEVTGDNIKYDNPTKIEIDAIGSTYLVKINGNKATSATIQGITEGSVGLWFSTSNFNDRVEFYAPRFMDFSVESLPK